MVVSYRGDGGEYKREERSITLNAVTFVKRNAIAYS